MKKTALHLVRIFGYSSAPNTTIAFQGGDTSIYRLTLTTGPFLTHTMPLTAGLANPGTVAVIGWNLPADSQFPVMAWGTSQPELEPLGDMRVPTAARLGFVFNPEVAGSARLRLVPWSTVAVTGGLENRDPILIVAPQSVTGCLRQPKQTDQYRIALKKGDPLLVTLESLSLDLLLDPLVKLTTPSGKPAGEVDDSGSGRDCVLAHKAAEDGDYILSVTDRHRYGSDRGFYLVTARLEESDFEITAGADAFVVNPDKLTEVTFTIVRRAGVEGAIGPITIEVIDLPPGVTATPVTSEIKGDTEKKVTLQLAADGQPFSGRLRFRGTATMPKELQRFARTQSQLETSFESFWLTVIEKKPPAENK